jgi:hypothetical protein
MLSATNLGTANFNILNSNKAKRKIQLMKRDAYAALVMVIIFTLGNLIAGLINDAHGIYLGAKDAIQSSLFFVFFGFFFWLSCIPRIRIRKSLRLPLVRAIFWTFVSIGLWYGDASSQMATADFIDATIPLFCFFTNTIGLVEQKFIWTTNSHFHVIGVYIIGVTLYQIAVIELSYLIVSKVRITAINKEHA